MSLTQKQLDSRKKWREANKEKVQKSSREYYLKKKQDPTWYAEHKNRSRNRQDSISNYDKALENGYYDEYYQVELNFVKRLLHNAKYRSSQKGIPFDIVVEDLTIPSFCPIYNIPIVIPSSITRKNTKGCRSTPNAPSLDRIDSSKGYTRDNVHIISFIANQHKSNASLDEMILLGEWATTQKLGM